MSYNQIIEITDVNFTVKTVTGQVVLPTWKTVGDAKAWLKDYLYPHTHRPARAYNTEMTVRAGIALWIKHLESA